MCRGMSSLAGSSLVSHHLAGKAARGHLERSGDDRRAFTAGILLPGCFSQTGLPQSRFHALKVCAAFFIVAGATKQQPEALDCHEGKDQ